jgi:hypothetical protein
MTDRRLTRRDLLRLSAAVVGMAAAPSLPLGASLATGAQAPIPGLQSAEAQLYSETLKAWCDGLLAHQVTEIYDPAVKGGLLCPACALIHGRCGDAVYPLLRMAHSTGKTEYLRAATLVHEWSQAQVSRADGSWVNDVSLGTWQGITVFHAIALAEALEHHGVVLDVATRLQWTDRLAQSARFLDQFITIETGNVNYPVTATLAFQLCGQVLGDSHYLERARRLAQDVLEQFSSDGFLFGEGHPLNGVTAKGCRPVDLGYNVEESLPALALYSLLADDRPVQEKVISAMRAHMEFMLPDGGWDNSWGTRNYKWTWWGSRTSDGCHPGFVLMSKFEPRFREVARRNLELMAACTHGGLLYGGPDYFHHGDLPCVHHTFTHAKALASVLDRATFSEETVPRPFLPRDEPYGLKTFPSIGTKLAAIGPWRASVTEYDWEYAEHLQPGADSLAGGHVSGGALSVLYHQSLGPLLAASMTEYLMIEIANQQQFRDGPHMALTPRIECAAYTSVNDFKAVLTSTRSQQEITFSTDGQLLTSSHHAFAGGRLSYHLEYRLSEKSVELSARAEGQGPAAMRFVLPVIIRPGERIEQLDRRTIRMAKTKGTLTVTADIDLIPIVSVEMRTFNLVPGFEAVPIEIPLEDGQQARVRFEEG